MYSLQAWQDQEYSPNVVIGTLWVFLLNVYALLDPGATLSFVPPYIAVNLGVIQKILSEPFASTQVGDPFIAMRVYINFSIIVSLKITSTYLVELEMADFCIILRWIGYIQM